MDTESKSRCIHLCDDAKIPTQLQDLLPLSYSYKLKKWTLMENKCNQFEAVILTNVYTEEEAQEWWHEFNAKSNTTMRVRATCPKTGKVNIFKIYLRCLHQGRAEKLEIQSPKGKGSSTLKRNTGCPAGMIIAIRRFVKYSRSKIRDPVDPIHPCEIQIKFIHNHPINSVDSLRFRPVSREAEEKLLSLFMIGHSPSSALETLKFDLQAEYGPDYSKFASDRYHCPDKSFCFRLYYKNFGKEFANAALRDLCNTLDSKILQYNADFGETCISVKRSNTDYIIAVCTPLMKRAHSLQQSSSIIYVESSQSPGSKERTDHFVFLFIVHTAAGGVPLGVIITTKNTAQLLSLGFQLLKELLPEEAFCGRGIAGPHAFFIEDSDSQRIALGNTWPEALIVLCIFRMLQFMWRWLWDEKHNIHSDHRLYLLYLIKTVLYASSELEMTTKYQALVTDNIIVHYPMFSQQVEMLWLKRHFWGICFYQLLPLDSASNYYEAAVRALKDRIFEQLKFFNLVQLMDFLLTRFDLFYKSKLNSILDGKINHILRTHFSYDIPPEISQGIKQAAGNYFLVPSDVDDKMFTIDPELNSCTCSVGISGAFCQHQYWIFLKIPNNMFMISFLDDDLKKKLQFVITGSEIHANDIHCLLSLPVHCNSNADVPVEESNLSVDNSFVKSCIQSISNSDIDQMSLAAGSLVAGSDTSENDGLQVLSEINNFKSSQDLQLQNVADSALSELSSNLSSPLKTEDFINNDNGGNGLDTSRMNEVAGKFEQFCQRVKDGLKSQPSDFIPAVEIMMKNLERKGNTSNLLVAGLSFFGVLADTTLKSKERKRPTAASKVIVPRVYGRQMITYGKRKKTSDSTENKTLGELPSIENMKPSPEPSSTSLQLNSPIDLNPLQYLRIEMDQQMVSQALNNAESVAKLPNCVNTNPE